MMNNDRGIGPLSHVKDYQIDGDIYQGLYCETPNPPDAHDEGINCGTSFRNPSLMLLLREMTAP